METYFIYGSSNIFEISYTECYMLQGYTVLYGGVIKCKENMKLKKKIWWF